LLLDSLRHCSGPIDFSTKEAANWGSAVQDASTLVKELTQCDRVYAIAFGEGAQHLHLHLIPRFIANPATKAWSVADHYRSIDSDQSRQVPQDHLNDFVIKARRIKGTILRYS
jgi:diadenosine tetraphosphate (Ap4A) HIT family hydrolase